MHNEITKLLVNICKMQKCAVKEEILEEMCDGKLGACSLGRARFNTRPLEIYTDDDKAWGAPVDRENPSCEVEREEKTCIFRIERVVDGTATFRALKTEKHGEECGEGHGHRHHEKFKSTNSFVTIRLDKIAKIRCLKDTFVNLCIR